MRGGLMRSVLVKLYPHMFKQHNQETRDNRC